MPDKSNSFHGTFKKLQTVKKTRVEETEKNKIIIFCVKSPAIPYLFK